MKHNQLLMLGSAMAGIISCTVKETPQAPNILVFIADDVSYDDLACTGNPDVQTPNIDHLADEGIIFNNVYLTASSCSPSRISIMTGRYPHNTGAAELHSQPDVNFPTIASELKKAGYYTLSSGKWHMGDLLKSGFDTIHTKGELILNGGEGMWETAIKERPKDKPFFMWLAAFDAHRGWGENDFSGVHEGKNLSIPAYLSDSSETRSDLACYYDEIHRFDYYIGRVCDILETQNALDNTLIIIMADNGRPFPGSKTRVVDRGMKTPFIVSWQEGMKEKGVASGALLSVIDIAPTLLELAGVEKPGTFQGRSFLKVLRKPSLEFRKYVFAEHNWHDYEAFERMVRSKEHLYLRNYRPLFPNQGPADVVNSPSFRDLLDLKEKGLISSIQNDIFTAPRDSIELYDCYKDPLQFNNVSGKSEYRKIQSRMDSILLDWMDKTGDYVPDSLTPDRFDRFTGKLLDESGSYNMGKTGEMPGSANSAVLINKDSGF